MGGKPLAKPFGRPAPAGSVLLGQRWLPMAQGGCRGGSWLGPWAQQAQKDSPKSCGHCSLPGHMGEPLLDDQINVFAFFLNENWQEVSSKYFCPWGSLHHLRAVWCAQDCTEEAASGVQHDVTPKYFSLSWKGTRVNTTQVSLLFLFQAEKHNFQRSPTRSGWLFFTLDKMNQ